MSFLIKSPTESILISGDIILGTPSAVVENLDTYLTTLKSLQKLKIDYLLLPHSLALNLSDILVPA
jgi:glyoxylase-like metal-dependent hydrolase (beta-lactamase superfamily II)